MSPILRTLIPLVSTISLFVGPVSAQRRALAPEIEINQATLMSGGYPFRKVVESGRHLFSTPFTTDDAYGEGPDGPRLSTQSIYGAPGFGYLRLNGLDAQSCFECHFTIGSDHLFDTQSQALSRKVGVMAGAGGIAANVFNNPSFPDPLVTFIRNPPHVFGAGYTQQLAEEMTLELMAQRDAARLAAMDAPDAPVIAHFKSKGSSYGSGEFVYTGGKAPSDPKAVLLGNPKAAFSEDYANLEGVSEDLVIRPFQWKGIASNARNFVKDALNFHFSVQAEERWYRAVGGAIVITQTDQDRDGVHNELQPGNVTALTAFVLSVRPPARQIPAGLESVAVRGEDLFLGNDPAFPQGSQSCASCHVPSLTMRFTEANIIDPTNPDNIDKIVEGPPSISSARRSALDLPVAKRYRALLAGLKEEDFHPGRFASAVFLNGGDKGARPTGMTFDLTDIPDALPLSFPRLPENATGEVAVPLFSDLKRHRMGTSLTDVAPQQTDVAGVFVPADEFLTRPLWGVADTGPWLHDGRALTLREAIVLHKSEGSEANPSVEIFEALSTEDQGALITFLLTFRLPEESVYAKGEGLKSGWVLR